MKLRKVCAVRALHTLTLDEHFAHLSYSSTEAKSAQQKFTLLLIYKILC